MPTDSPAPRLSSWTVRASSLPFVEQDKGIDSSKKINARKCHFAVDVNGYPLAVYVGVANQSNGETGLELLAQLDKQNLERLRIIRADKAYRGNFYRSGGLF